MASRNQERLVDEDDTYSESHNKEDEVVTHHGLGLEKVRPDAQFHVQLLHGEDGGEHHDGVQNPIDGVAEDVADDGGKEPYDHRIDDSDEEDLRSIDVLEDKLLLIEIGRCELIFLFGLLFDKTPLLCHSTSRFCTSLINL